jgi:hypothetical protein
MVPRQRQVREDLPRDMTGTGLAACTLGICARMHALSHMLRPTLRGTPTKMYDLIRSKKRKEW